MLQTIQTNVYESARDKLLQQLHEERQSHTDASDIASAFFQQTVVVPSETMADDLKRFIAADSSFGICTNINFLKLDQWLKEIGAMAPQILEDNAELDWVIWKILSEWDAWVTRWQAEGVVSEKASESFERLQRFLDKHKNNEVARFELARQISEVFISYTYYRLDWVLDWVKGEEDQFDSFVNTDRQAKEYAALEKSPDLLWQQFLWRAIRESNWRGIAAIKEIVVALQKAQNGENPTFKKTVHVFMPEGMPPLAMPFMQAFAQAGNLTLYVLKHSNGLSSVADLSEYLEKNTGDEARTFNRLAKVAVPQNAMLIEDDMPDGGDLQALVLEERKINTETVLGGLHKAITSGDLNSIPQKLQEADESFKVVKATSIKRETEGVVDWILHTIRHSKGLANPIKSEDILVVTPDIDRVASLLPGVINAIDESVLPQEQKPYFYHLAGLALSNVNGIVEAILAAGDFIHSRADLDSFMNVLSREIVSLCWRQDPSDFATLRNWLVAAGYRDGLNDAHLETHGVKTPSDGTLDRALERLVLGMLARDGEKILFGDAVSVQGTEMTGFDLVGEKSHLATFLCAFSQALIDMSAHAKLQSVEEWQNWVNQLVEKVFPNAERLDDYRDFQSLLRQTVNAAEKAIGKAPMPFEVFWLALTNNVRQARTWTIATGRVTFAPITAFRRLPYKAVAVIGLNDNSGFPGQLHAKEFDLMHFDESIKRTGDRDTRQMNRNVFFDLVMSARDRLYLSYNIGGNPVAQKTPSVVLLELAELVTKRVGAKAFEKQLTYTMPTQNYSPENFSMKAGSLQSHDSKMCEAVKFAIQKNYLAPQTPFVGENGSIDAFVEKLDAPVRFLSEKDLTDFWSDPNKWTLKQYDVETVTAEKTQALPFAIDDMTKLAQAGFRRRLLAELTERGTEAAAVEEITRALKHDPIYGAEVVREEGIDAEVSKLIDLLNAKDEAVKDAKRTPSDFEAPLKVEPIQANIGPFKGIAVSNTPTDELYELPAGMTIVSICLSTSALTRAFIHWLLVNYVNQTKNDPLVDLIAVCQDGLIEHKAANFNVTAIVDDLLALLNAHCLHTPLLSNTVNFDPDEYGNPNVDTVLWRGNDLVEKCYWASKGVKDCFAVLVKIDDEDGVCEIEDKRKEFHDAVEHLLGLSNKGE